MPMLTRAYEITDRPGARLYVGIPHGRHRPALWIKTPELGENTFVILAQFHGEKEAVVAANFLDTLIGQIQRVIDHLAGEHDNGN
jgi:hypothetical protein